MVALFLVVLPLTREHTVDGAPVVVRQLGFAASVGLLLLPLDHETVPLVAIRGMKQATLLISGIAPEELLDTAHDAGIFGGSALSRSGSLVAPAMAPRAASSRTVGIQVLVAFFFQRQLQKQHRQVLVGEGPCLALRRCPAFIPHFSSELSHQPE